MALTDYKNEAAVRVKIVDRLLRTHADGTPYGNNEGASYRDMVEALVGLDKGTKKELAIPDSLLQDETLYHAARLRMQKTLESICDAYAATHELTPDRKAKKSRADIRKELLVEIPRRKETGCKLFRYRNRDYSVIESGDYEKYLSGEKSPVFVKIYPSATDCPSILHPSVFGNSLCRPRNTSKYPKCAVSCRLLSQILACPSRRIC